VSVSPTIGAKAANVRVALNIFGSHGRWLCCEDRPRVWFSRYEREQAPHAPAAPLEDWTENQTLAAMIEAISMRADIREVCTARQ
jgi:hypothetical protein